MQRSSFLILALTLATSLSATAAYAAPQPAFDYESGCSAHFTNLEAKATKSVVTVLNMQLEANANEFVSTEPLTDGNHLVFSAPNEAYFNTVRSQGMRSWLTIYTRPDRKLGVVMLSEKLSTGTCIRWPAAEEDKFVNGKMVLAPEPKDIVVNAADLDFPMLAEIALNQAYYKPNLYSYGDITQQQRDAIVKLPEADVLKRVANFGK